jgi:microcin C transport system substrate-binding protein
MRMLVHALLLLVTFVHAPAFAQSDADPKKLVMDAAPVALPPDIVWETNETAPLIGSEKAIRGGRFTAAIGAYPLTFRLIGPNANDFFSAWNRTFALMDKHGGLVMQHPTTDEFIPMLATHWSIQKDQRTIFLKLDRDAKFSDGKPVTANDYVFTWRLMQSKFILDPFYNSYAEQYLTSVDRVDDYTLRIVGTRPSWRPLYDYAGLWPTAMHASPPVDKDWVNATTNVPQVVPGPYVISDMQRGESITFKRVPNWWGDKKRYFKGLYNFDEIHLRVMPIEREIDYLRRGEIDVTTVGSKLWYEGLDVPEVRNGWVHKSRMWVDTPKGLLGMQMNLQAPIFQNRDFRIAMHYLFNYDRVNRNLFYGETYRKNSFFDGTIYENPDLKARPFDPAKAREFLAKAGYHRPADIGGTGFFAALKRTVRGLIFTRSDSDDILVNDKGEPATFTMIHYSKNLEAALTVIQQDFRRAGVDLRLQLLEPGAAFQRMLERKFEMAFLAMGASFYPDPRQYLHSYFKGEKNNNNFWGYGTKDIDEKIQTYEENLDADARMAAMHTVDQAVHDEAFYIPFWDVKFMRVVHWDYLQFPETYLPKRSDDVTDWLVQWIDPAKKAAVEEAKQAGKAFPIDPEVDKDFYGIRKKMQ